MLKMSKIVLEDSKNDKNDPWLKFVENDKFSPSSFAKLSNLIFEDVTTLLLKE